MKKLFIITVLVIVTMLLVMPKIIGIRLQSILTDFIEENKTMILSKDVSVNLSSIDINSGWFSSSGKLVYTVNIKSNEKLDFIFNIDINHGPVLFNSKNPTLGMGYFSIVPDLSAIEEQALAKGISLPDISMWGILGFSQEVDFGMNMAPYEFVNNKGHNFSISGVHIKGEVDKYKSYIFDVLFEKINFNSHFDSLEIKEIVINGEGESLINPFSYKMYSIKMPSFIVSKKKLGEEMDLTVSEIEFSGITKIEGKPALLNSFVNMSVANIDGPFPISSINIKQELLGISKNFADWSFSVAELPASDFENEEKIMQIFSEGGQILLKTPLTFGMDVVTNVFGGDHISNLTVQWLGIDEATGVTVEELMSSANREEILLSRVLANWLFELDEVSILQSPAGVFLQPYVNNGILTANNGIIIIDIKYKDGNIMVNDQVFPIKQFQ